MDAATVIMLLAFAGTLLSFLAAGSYFLPRGKMAERTKGVAAHRQELAARQMSGLQQPRGIRPKSQRGAELLKTLVDRFNLKDLFEAKELRSLLNRGGFRNPNAATMFISASLAGPVVLPALVYFYLTATMPHLETARLIFAILAAAGAGYYAPRLFVGNAASKRQKAMTRSFPDALDLLVICVEAGLSLEGAVNRVTEEMAVTAPEIAEEIGLLGAELAFLGDRRQAYENFADRTGLEAAKSLSTTLIQSERYGTSIATGLRVLSQESRDTRLSAAEKKAAALPAKLTVPMILFFLPVLFIVIAGPAAIGVGGK